MCNNATRNYAAISQLPLPPFPNLRSASTHARDTNSSPTTPGRTRAKRCVRRGRTQALPRKDHAKAVYHVVCVKYVQVLELIGKLGKKARRRSVPLWSKWQWIP